MEARADDSLSSMRFLGLGLSDRVLDAKTVWLFRECLTQMGAIEGLFNRFDTTLRNAGSLPMSGQILDAALIAAPKQRNTNTENADLRAGRILDDWQDKPAKLSHKDRHARWTLKFMKAKRQDDGTIPTTDLATPYPAVQCRKVRDPIPRRARLCRSEITDRAVRPNFRYYPGHHEDRARQYRL